MKPSERVSGGLLTKALYPMAIAAFALSALDIVVFSLFRFEQIVNTLMVGLGLIVVDALILFGVLRSCINSIQPLQAELDESVKLIDKISGASANEIDTSISSSPLLERLENLAVQVNETRNRERKIIDNAVDVICVIDVDERFLSLSPSVVKRWGYSEDELLGKKLSEFLVSDGTEQSLASILGARASIEKITFENRFKHKQGDIIDLAWTAHWSARDEGLFCVAHDISARKQAEAKIQESEQRLRVTLEAMPIGVVCTTQSGTIEFANESFGKFVGGEPAALVGTALSKFLPASEKDKITAYLNDAKSATVQLKSIESLLERAEQDDVPVDISATMYKAAGASKLLVSFSDTSERKEVENIRREFVAMINHDLRTPLTSLIMLIELLDSGLHGELLPKGKEACNLALIELQRLMRLVNDLLDLEKLESGKLFVQQDMVCVLDIIEASVSSLKSYAESRDLKIVYPETEADCWADRSRVIQVLVNLLSNAIKFSPAQSSINIAVEELPDCVKISVSDEGRGIPADKGGQLFKRFVQMKLEDARVGSGLGLSICKAIVDAHNGTIGFVNKQPTGSCFYFTLPHKSS